MDEERAAIRQVAKEVLSQELDGLVKREAAKSLLLEEDHEASALAGCWSCIKLMTKRQQKRILAFLSDRVEDNETWR